MALQDVKTIFITVRLGTTPRFEVLADPRDNAARDGAAYSCSGVGTTNADILRAVLAALNRDYPIIAEELDITNGRIVGGAP